MKRLPLLLVTLLLLVNVVVTSSAVKISLLSSFDPEDYLKEHFDPDQNEIGFRIGRPFLECVIDELPGKMLKDTRFNEVEAHNFHLKSIGTDGIRVGLSVRWKQFENNPNPLDPARIKRAETNCDAIATVKPFVRPDHSIAVPDPVISGLDCTTSGFGVEQLFDYMFQGMSFVLSGGKNKIGLIETFIAVGALIHNLQSYFSDSLVFVSDPVTLQVIPDHAIPLAKKIGFAINVQGFDENHNEVVLTDMRYDAKGVWYIFSYPEWLASIAEPIHAQVQKGFNLTEINASIDVIHVRSGLIDGTGSIFRPFGTLREAVNNVPSDGIISMVAGSYPESLTISVPVRLESQGGIVRIGTN